MTYLEVKVLHIPKNETVGTEVTGIKRISIRMGSEARSNTSDLILKNVIGGALDASGNFRFKEKDTIKIYAKINDDGIAIDTTSNTDLLTIAKIIEWKGRYSDNPMEWIIKCADNTYMVLNRLYARSYPVGTIDTAPKIVKDIVKNTTQETDQRNGEFLPPDEVFSGLDVRLVSEGGKIEDTRTDSSAFPAIRPFARTFKPVYEWLRDLSSIENTNSETELDPATTPPDIVQKRAMRFLVDETNVFHWFYPDDTVDSYLEEGKKKGEDYRTGPNIVGAKVQSVNLSNEQFDSVNMIIFSAGKDMNGTGILGYVFDETQPVKQLKMTFRTYPTLVKTLLAKDYTVTTAADRKNGGGTPNEPEYPLDIKYPFTPTFTTNSVSTDGKYNSELRKAVKKFGEEKIAGLITKIGGIKWRGKIVTEGAKFNPGELLTITASSFAGELEDQKVRIVDVVHQFSDRSWTTTLSVEEDEKEITYI